MNDLGATSNMVKMRRRAHRIRPLAALGTALALLATFACQRRVESRTYQLHGQVLAVKPETRELLVKHDDIQGFMPAMTMPYRVDDPALLTGRLAGDLITATLVVSEDRARFSAITKTGSAPLPDDAPTRMPVASGVHVLQAGDVVPDTRLTAEDGAALSLANWRGSAVALTFIYTSCPLPEFCPLMDRRFAETQKLAGADAALRGRVRLLSVSFDPATDRPARLAAHAATLGADKGVWRFATADADTVERFAAQFGVNVIREKDGTITHNLRTAVIDPAGRVTAVLDSNGWTAAQLADELRRALHP